MSQFLHKRCVQVSAITKRRGSIDTHGLLSEKYLHATPLTDYIRNDVLTEKQPTYMKNAYFYPGHVCVYKVPAYPKSRGGIDARGFMSENRLHASGNSTGGRAVTSSRTGRAEMRVTRRCRERHTQSENISGPNIVENLVTQLN